MAPYEYTVTPVINHTTDRIFTLEQIDGKAPANSTGLLDRRLFTGSNKLHAILDETTLWVVKYEQGNVPKELQRKFTSFRRLMEFVKEYFAKRNVKITEITD